MGDLKIISNRNQIKTNSKWISAAEFDGKNKVVNYKGRQVQIVELREHTYSDLERFGRGCIGTLAVICTLCLSLFSKQVRGLFTKSKTSIRYAIPLSPSSNENLRKSDQFESKQVLKGEIVQKSTKTAKIALNPEQRRIIEEFTPQMVEALGGVDKVLSLPIIEESVDDWVGDSLSEKLLTAPVVRGYCSDGSPFIIFCYLKNTAQGISGEYLKREKKNSWKGTSCYSSFFVSELNLCSPNPILDGSLEEKYMLDKISRLMSGKAIGVLKKYPNIIFNKPEDKMSFMPGDAYLQREELLDYMNADTLFYEEMPENGTTSVILHDPRIQNEGKEDDLPASRNEEQI